MPTVRSSLRVPAPAQEVFDLTQDYYLRSQWDPFVRAIRMFDGAQTPGVGVRVWVQAWTGLTMEVEYTSYNPPEIAAVKMARGPRFFTSFAGAWRFVAVNSSQTDVEFLYSYRTRWKRLRPVMDPLIGLIFRRDLRRRLAGLLAAVESGEH